MNININKGAHAKAAAYQNFGFHLVTKSPWPILMSFSLLNLAIGAVLCMHGFNHGSSVISIGLIITIFGMGLWFRDIVTEGTRRRAMSYINLYFLGVGRGAKEVLVVAQAYLTLFLLTVTNNNKKCLYNYRDEIKIILAKNRSSVKQKSSLITGSLNLSLQRKNLYLGRTNQQSKFITRALQRTERLSYSTLTGEELVKTPETLSPYFITGFSDGEACFSLIIKTNPNFKTGWGVELNFVIVLHKKDLPLLESINFTLGGIGIVSKGSKDTFRFRVGSAKNLELLIEHFDKFPLISDKWGDYILFRQAFEIYSQKLHLSKEGLVKLVALKATINKGTLSDRENRAIDGVDGKLTKAFPLVKAVARPLIQNKVIKNPYWFAGFANAEGCFFVQVQGKYALLKFVVVQHIRDIALLESFVDYLDCGRIEIDTKKNISCFLVTKISDIIEKVIPFFNKYSIKGDKALDFADFCKAAQIIKNKEHLTSEGFNKIQVIKAGMNRRRTSV